MANTKDNNWVILSRMSLDPAEAYGKNERYDLYYVLKRKNITLEELGFKPPYDFLWLFEKTTKYL